MAYIGKQPVVGNFQVCDAISVVNGQAAYTMQVGGSNVEPENANHMLVSLNGILQKPGSSFTISGATITFASNLATGDVIDFITLLGDTLNTGQPSDATVTSAKLSGNLVTPGTLDVNGNELILDADADSSITADTDDQIDFKTAGNDAMKIDSGGHVTMPLQSAVHAYPNTAQDNMSTGIVTIALGAEIYDVNSDFDTSSSTFTAPVTGKYQVNASVTISDIDTAYQWMYGILLVSSNRNYYLQQIQPRYEITEDYSSYGRGFNASTLVDMDANDTLLLKVRHSSHGSAQHDVVVGSASAPETFLTVHLAC